MKKTFIPLFVGLLCWTGAQAAIRYVSPSGKDANDGLSVATAKATLTAALNSATSDDEIRVQAGTYEGTYTMKDGVNVSGGWNSTFDVQNGTTTLDGNKSGRVLTQDKNFATWTEWSNFTITNGSVSGNGGGVQLCKKGRIKNCTVTGNTATGNGGGVFNDAVDVATDVLIDNCTISSNKSTEGNGGGLYIRGTIQFSTIQSNKTTGSGKPAGGAQLQGGRMVNCKVISNEASGNAGGVRLWNSCELINTLVAKNTANEYCGGVSDEGNEGNLSNIINCTIVENHQVKSDKQTDWCGLRCGLTQAADKKLVNNVIWCNTAGNASPGKQMNDNVQYYNIRQSNAFHGDLPANYGEGQIVVLPTQSDNNKWPYFTKPEDNDYSLQFNSALRNKGNDTYMQGDMDLEGNTRKVDSYVDVGAYEYQYVHSDRNVSVGDNLQDVIDHTYAGFTVKVQEGTFTGNFVMINNVDVEGGYNAGFSAVVGKTTLDANHSGRVLTQHVSFGKETTWSNFILQNGNASHDGVVAHDGGGAQLHHNGVLSNCIITNNTASGNAGGVVMERGGKVLNSKIVSNTAELDDGGVRMTGEDYSGTLANCLVANNTAKGKTGGISLETREQYVYNNTIVNNHQTSLDNASCCGVRLNVGAALEFANNIVWGNKVGGTVQASQMEINKSYKGNYSYFKNNAIVWDGKLTENNTFDASPAELQLLNKDTNPFEENYQLNWDSKLVDAGTDSYYNSDNKDLDGNARKAGNHVDIGAYECPLTLDVNVLEGEDLQSKINYTAKGHSVKVQAGTFTGNFTMKEGVNVSGGWEDFNASAPIGETILDANHSGRPLTQNGDFTTETTWSNFTLTNGNVDGDGGGAYLRTKGALMNCKVQHNTATNAGGVCLHGKGKLANCLVVNNTATNLCGGVRVEDGSDIIGNTIAFNNQENSSNGAITHCGVSCLTSNQFTEGYLANNVIWGNKNQGSVQVENTGGSQIYYHGRYPDANKWNNAIYNIPFSSNGNINLTADPFVDAAGGNYRPAYSSDLIDMGNDEKATGDYDLAGNARKQGDKVDIGCYEQTKGKEVRTIPEGYFGTVCLPYAVAAADIQNAIVYKIISFATNEEKGLLLEQVDDMGKGKPYIFYAEAGTVTFGYVMYGDAALAGKKENGLVGVLSAQEIYGADNCVLQSNEFHPTYNSATSTNVFITVPANRAYLYRPDVPDAPDGGPVMSPRRRVLGIHSAPNSATGFDEVQGDKVQSTKVIRNGQLLILRDGHTYNALGMEVK